MNDFSKEFMQNPMGFIKIAGNDKHNAEVDRKLDIMRQNNQHTQLINQLSTINTALSNNLKAVTKQMKAGDAALENNLKEVTEQMRKGDEANEKQANKAHKLSVASLLISLFSLLVGIGSLVAAIIALN